MNLLVLLLSFLIAFGPGTVFAQTLTVPGSGSQLLPFGCNDNAGASNQFMFTAASTSACPTSELISTPAVFLAPTSGTLRRIQCTLQTTPTAGTTWTWTARVNQASTTLACGPVANGTTSCDSGIVSVRFAAASQLSVLWSETGGGIDGAITLCALLVTWDN